LHLERLYPSGLTLATPWKRGQQIIEDKYAWALPILHSISTTQNATILALFGMSLVTQHLIEEDDADDRESEESQMHASSLAEGFSDTPKNGDCTVGMRELEDAAADAQWSDALGDRQDNFTNVIRIGKHKINKSHAIAQHFRYTRSVSSTNRLRCIAQESRFRPGHNLNYTPSGDSCSDEPSLSILQPIAMLVFCDQRLFLCIAEVNSLFLDGNLSRTFLCQYYLRRSLRSPTKDCA
jgi:hypothetical protein